MKKIFLILSILAVINFATAQTQVDSLVKTGLEFHYNGLYEEAIAIYKKALEIEPGSELANHEISISYHANKEYEKSITHCDVVIKNGGKLALLAYVTKGSNYDYMSLPKESVKVYNKGLKKIGNHYLLHYNKGVTLYKINELAKAEEAFTQAIQSNPSHASSHLLLAYLMADKNNKIKSLLGLHYFLFLEPNSSRSSAAFELLQELFGSNVSKDPEKENTINISIDPTMKDDEFSMIETMIALMVAANYTEKNEGKTKNELFAENTSSFFTMLGDRKEKKNKGLWWDFYIPFFYEIGKSNQITTYCHYISQSTDKEAEKWLKENINKLDEFEIWLKTAYK